MTCTAPSPSSSKGPKPHRPFLNLFKSLAAAPAQPELPKPSRRAPTPTNVVIPPRPPAPGYTSLPPPVPPPKGPLPSVPSDPFALRSGQSPTKTQATASEFNVKTPITPSRQYPPVAFLNKKNSRSHLRTASSPTNRPRTPSSRARSATLQEGDSAGAAKSPTLEVVVVPGPATAKAVRSPEIGALDEPTMISPNDLALTPPLRLPQVHRQRPRPSALRLITSNLSARRSPLSTVTTFTPPTERDAIPAPAEPVSSGIDAMQEPSAVRPREPELMNRPVQDVEVLSAISTHRPVSLVRDKRRSRSTGDLLQLVSDMENLTTFATTDVAPLSLQSQSLSSAALYYPHAHTRGLNHRYSRSESWLVDPATTPSEWQGPNSGNGSGNGMSNTAGTPASVFSTLSILSSATPTPTPGNKPKTPSSASSFKGFENVPIPYALLPLSTLQTLIPKDGIANLLNSSPPSPDSETQGRSGPGRESESMPRPEPWLLHPSTMATIESEKQRLGTELAHLQIKHNRLIRHRDKLLSRLGPPLSGKIPGGPGAAEISNPYLKIVQDLRDAIKRVDRTGRQVYICNDQVKQMDVLLKSHEIGVMSAILQRRGIGVGSAGTTSPGIAALAGGASEGNILGVEVEVDPYTPRPDKVQRTPHQLESLSEDAVRLDRSSTLKIRESTSGQSISPASSRPVSTMTTLLLSPTTLGFPLPPSRSDLAQDLQLQSVNPEPGPELELDFGDTDSCHTVTGNSNGSSQGNHHILIYPPDHVSPGRSGLLTPEMPSTPYRTSTSSEADQGLSGEMRLQPQAEVIQGERPRKSSTSPLRFAARSKSSRSTVQALSSWMPPAGFDDPTGIQKRFKRGRESSLETPESILLSLATADLWMRGDHISGSATRVQ